MHEARGSGDRVNHSSLVTVKGKDKILKYDRSQGIGLHLSSNLAGRLDAF